MGVSHLKLLEEFSGKLSQKFSTLSIVLFGSLARGEITPESDVDLLILCNKSDLKKVEQEAFNVSYDLTLKNGLFVQVLVMESNGFEKMLKSKYPLAYEIIYDGKILHDQNSKFEKLRASWLKRLHREEFLIRGNRVARYEVAKT